MNPLHKVRLRTFFILLTCFSTPPAFSQTILNGHFDDSVSGWGCDPKTGLESAYGGSGSNTVAEIAAASQLCQTISGFIPGELYCIHFLASGAMTCDPASRSMEVAVSDSALSVTVLRDGAVFLLEEEVLSFVATAETHTLTFSTDMQESCSMIVDNIRVGVASLMSVDLVGFGASVENGSVELSWTSASELGNDFYTLYSSEDTQHWNMLVHVPGAGTTLTQTDYTFNDMDPSMGVRYYLLSQTDMNGSCKELKTVSVSVKTQDSLMVFPNPVGSKLSVYGTGMDGEVTIYNASGKIVHRVPTPKEHGMPLILSVAGLPSGIYIVETATGYCRFIKK